MTMTKIKTTMTKIETTMTKTETMMTKIETTMTKITDEFITIRSNYSYDLIMGYTFVEDGDVCTERLPTCDWMDYIPMDRKEESLFIRISEIKEAICYCKSCNI